MKYKAHLVFISIVLLSFACEKDDKEQTSCDQKTIISKSEYDTAPLDDVSILDMEIDGDCLKISFSASGCDGSTWIVKLIDSGMTFYTSPPQKDLILSLENNELCDAVISKEISFDIENLQVSGNLVVLNIINTGDEILYEF